MSLETATYISGLVATNPVHATDDVSQGDDHLRLIKSTLLATFPNITGAVTSSHTELNLLAGVTTPTGSGALVLATSPTIVSPTISTGITLPNASIADAALSSNVPLLNKANVFTQTQKVSATGTAQLQMQTTGSDADEGLWSVQADQSAGTSRWRLRTRTDAEAFGADPILVTRGSGAAAASVALTADTEIDLTAASLDFNGTAAFSSTVQSETGGFRGPDGSVSAGGFAFANDTDTGIYLSSTGVLGITAAGAARALFSAAEVDLSATTLDLNGNIDANGTTSDIAAGTSLALHGGSVSLTLSSTTFVVDATTMRLNTSTTTGAVAGSPDRFLEFNINGSTGYVPVFDTPPS